MHSNNFRLFVVANDVLITLWNLDRNWGYNIDNMRNSNRCLALGNN
ncbi:MAG: hypothetical protein CM15mP65_28550 [Crocinitomicaceae bacterium]|nr:MAG: hypothetical protein CM15mP65_28550 [Crocinitomicaceae bacterium]